MSNAPLLVVDPAWRHDHPGASAGVLAMRGVANPAAHDGLNALATALEEEVRASFGAMERSELRNVPPLPAYAAYYKRWGQRYHVGMQLESVAQKGKPLPRVAALVEAMFIAELRNLLLTAGHDLDQIELPVRIDSGAGETFRSPSGAEMIVKPGDMFIADAQDRVLSAIITGPSDVARIGPQTIAAAVYVYAPPGVDAVTVSTHLDEIERNIRLIAPDAETVGREVVVA
jgi:DNA/RNA-binding domain of Phe-tRNA-synthetase-like protein